ncbi:hypothetical protein EV361DRAFT_813310 [Lentinula raphanica]|nr:hypothetical protein EV361DRAFT_813310 [Lentinula raphanica]
MVDELEILIPKFLGRKAHIRCFTHTVNLAAKGILRPFEPNRGTTNVENDHANANSLGIEELNAELRDLEEHSNKDRDDEEGFVAVLEEMIAEERENWVRDVEPVKSMLYKTRKISYKIINLPTGLLPKWKEHLVKAQLPDCILPHDVATRWNSTYDMLDSFLQMKTAISDFVDRSSHNFHP